MIAAISTSPEALQTWIQILVQIRLIDWFSMLLVSRSKLLEEDAAKVFHYYGVHLSREMSVCLCSYNLTIESIGHTRFRSRGLTLRDMVLIRSPERQKFSVSLWVNVVKNLGSYIFVAAITILFNLIQHGA